MGSGTHSTDRNEAAVAGRIDKLSRRKPPVHSPKLGLHADPSELHDGTAWATMRGEEMALLHSRLGVEVRMR